LGGEYNQEMKRLMLDHAFNFVKRVVFVVGENNMRSQKALQKIGARFLKTLERRTATAIPEDCGISNHPLTYFAAFSRHRMCAIQFLRFKPDFGIVESRNSGIDIHSDET